ncbi:11579_t:CDS:2 [Funneliformis geosporum]|uniref:non-specific serine/threonine protein kinase n=1 Tax=Funneliformis geosporum TaxID=1117311 RepID=A0A9W4SAM5_9GLOM|nr:11579_t:CDS:2 [Funneliformis geosporum]
MGNSNSRKQSSFIAGRKKCKYPYLHWKRLRDEEAWSRPVALKSIKNSQDITSEYINELRTHHRCISAPPSYSGEMSKLYWLRNITGNLSTIHKVGFTHRNLHPGNILVGQVKKDGETVTVAKLAHLGLSRPANKKGPLDGLYGVLPYFAPEVLQGKKYTKDADIYCIGIIMAELSTGIPPFVDRAHDTSLAIEICKGLRPSFAQGTPDNYIRLACQCFNVNPSERPNAEFLAHTFHNWWMMTQKNDVLSDAFLAADKVIPELNTNFYVNPDAIYTSRLISFENNEQDSPKTVNFLTSNMINQN